MPAGRSDTGMQIRSWMVNDWQMTDFELNQRADLSGAGTENIPHETRALPKRESFDHWQEWSLQQFCSEPGLVLTIMQWAGSGEKGRVIFHRKVWILLLGHFHSVTYSEFEVTFQRQRVLVEVDRVALHWLYQMGSDLSTGHPFIALTYVFTSPWHTRIKCHRTCGGIWVIFSEEMAYLLTEARPLSDRLGSSCPWFSEHVLPHDPLLA